VDFCGRRCYGEFVVPEMTIKPLSIPVIACAQQA
jgi:hypothetical protein